MNIVQTLAPPNGAQLCAQEPIHIPGAIQPHGAFLAAGPDGRIAYASANIQGFVGMAAAAALGQSLEAVIGAEASAALQSAAPGPARTNPFYQFRRPDGGTLHLRSFRSGTYLGVDIEIQAALDSATLDSAQALQASLEGAGSQLELCAWTVSGLQTITGYARVMAYRFDPEGHGEVIAEACAPFVEPYLGLHYPASDIPAQARALFLRQRVGAVADASYQPVPLLAGPAAPADAPLDLTHSVLRSVSPVHRAYMRNMGTAASLTVSLVTEDALWGMLVCHHGSPRVAGPALRAVASICGQFVSLRLANMARAEGAARQADGQAALAELAARLAQGLPLLEALASPWLLGLVGAAGAAIRAGGQFRLAGDTPAPDAALQALAVLQAATGGEIFSASDLVLRHPELADCVRHGSGVLLLPLTPGTDDAILFFRPERRRKVKWGGNPADHLSRDPLTRQLTPRASFAAWEEMVSGHAAPWAPPPRRPAARGGAEPAVRRPAGGGARCDDRPRRQRSDRTRQSDGRAPVWLPARRADRLPGGKPPAGRRHRMGGARAGRRGL